MQQTTHYALNKPDPNDTYNKATDNGNMDAIDTQLYANAQAAAAAQTTANAAVPESAVGETVASLVNGQVPASQLGNVPTPSDASPTSPGLVEVADAASGTHPVAITTDNASYKAVNQSKYVTAGTGISVAAGTNGQTVTNTGVTGLTAGANIELSGSAGNVTVSVTGTVPNATNAGYATSAGSATTATTATNANELGGQSPSYYAPASSVPSNPVSALSGGKKIQSGSSSAGSSTGYVGIVTFPTAFSATPSVVCSPTNGNGSSYAIPESINNTGFSWVCTTNPTPMDWIAIGN